jgi:hypothetical protein
VVAAAALTDRARLSLAEASMWADALALMVEDGQEDAPRVLLARVVDELTAERVRSALLGRMGASDAQLAAQVDEVYRTAVDVPAHELPEWAEAGIIDPAGRRAYSRHTLDLDAAELADGMPWPPVTVMTFLVEGGPPACCWRSDRVVCRIGSWRIRPGGSAARSSRPRTWRTG